MPKNSKLPALDAKVGKRGTRFWLQAAVGTLAALNLAALVVYFVPPGGSREELTAESQHLRTEMAAARAQTTRLKRVSGKVQTGSEQSTDFEARYILPKRQAYETIIEEIQRMAKASSLEQGEGVWTEEPIEGTADLTILTHTTNFQGPYQSLMRFLYEVDHSPKLLMLYTLQATPQKAGQVTAQMKFQAIIRDSEYAAAGGQQ
ncbi:MAG TPA: type 4a pilus biogenesis protein PilO [Bryobacteraceae bacterium]|jgi:Tfp pilus assembly protein PilO|nr:type 4a pilus biogenesis protein PilO [Bryobacteraceae bacterium]